MKNNRIAILLILVGCILIAISIYRSYSSSNVSLSEDVQVESEERHDDTYEDFKAFAGEDARGYSLGFNNPNEERFGERLIWDSTADELELSFINASGDAEFLLKLFWNYEEVDFSIDGSEMSTSHVFQSNHGEDYKWSIKLSDEIDLSAKGFKGYLTPMIFIEPHLHQKEAQFYEHADYGIITTHHVFSDENFDDYNRYNVFNAEDFQPYNNYEGEFYGLNVTNDAEVLHNPSPYVTAKKGEQIKLDFILGDSTGEQIDEYILFAILGSEQAVINEHKALPVSLPISKDSSEPTPQFGELIIEAPVEEGQYEFVAYAVSLEREIRGLSFIENSFRITVDVE